MSSQYSRDTTSLDQEHQRYHKSCNGDPKEASQDMLQQRSLPAHQGEELGVAKPIVDHPRPVTSLLPKGVSPSNPIQRQWERRNAISGSVTQRRPVRHTLVEPPVPPPWLQRPRPGARRRRLHVWRAPRLAPIDEDLVLITSPHTPLRYPSPVPPTNRTAGDDGGIRRPLNQG